jgi:amidohydrolase
VRLKPEFVRWHDELTAWRHDLHAHPELGFEETRTAGIVGEKLSGWGIQVHRGLAGTGVVGTLHGRTRSDAAIALRADMDALPMQEENEFAHASTARGKMHGCGHDGHTTMLLAAARYLAQSRAFAGTVHFVFQPAEEGLGGGDRMVKEGLFTQFPCEAVFGFHNWPGMPIGTIGTRAGPMMAAADLFTIDIFGKGGHAALPHHTADPVVIAAHLVTALQTLVSRSTDPIEAAVVSVTGIEGGKAYNVIPERARLFGTVRSFTPTVRDSLEAGLKRLAAGTASMFGARAVVNYERKYPPVVNSDEEVAVAARAAAAVVGETNVQTSITPIMGSEDFAFMLEAKPGAYLFLGQAGGPSSCMIHNPRYDFNDALLPVGASFWVALVEQVLAANNAK